MPRSLMLTNRLDLLCTSTFAIVCFKFDTWGLQCYEVHQQGGESNEKTNPNTILDIPHPSVGGWGCQYRRCSVTRRSGACIEARC